MRTTVTKYPLGEGGFNWCFKRAFSSLLGQQEE